MLRRRRLLLLVAVAGAIAVACGSFTGTNGDGSATSSGDASVADDGAATSADAGLGAEGDVDGSRFCADAAAHDFCADFDDPQPLPSGGFMPGTQANYDAGEALVTSTQFTSAPRSLRVHLRSGASTPDATFYLEKSLGTAATAHATVAFDLYVGSLARLAPDAGLAAPDSRFAVFGSDTYTIEVNVANTTNGLVVDLAEIYSFSDAGPAYVAHDVIFSNHTFATKGWHHVVLSIDYAQKKLSFAMDGFAGTVSGATPSIPSASGPLFVDIGAQTDVLSCDVESYFDDVTVDIDRP